MASKRTIAPFRRCSGVSPSAAVIKRATVSHVGPIGMLSSRYTRGTRIAAASPDRTQPVGLTMAKPDPQGGRRRSRRHPAPSLRDVLEIGVHLRSGDGRQFAIGLREIGQKPLDLPSATATRARRSQSVALLGGDKMVHFTRIGTRRRRWRRPASQPSEKLPSRSRGSADGANVVSRPVVAGRDLRPTVWPGRRCQTW